MHLAHCSTVWRGLPHSALSHSLGDEERLIAPAPADTVVAAAEMFPAFWITPTPPSDSELPLAQRVINLEATEAEWLSEGESLIRLQGRYALALDQLAQESEQLPLAERLDALSRLQDRWASDHPDLAVELFNRRSIYGKAVVATFNDRDAAKLMGINTGLVITFSYALSSLTASFAGVLIAPLTLTGATMGAVLGLKAFAVAIIGGLTSGMGIIVGGIILGVAETTTGFYLSTGYKDVPGLVLLLIVLAVKPAGLFGKTAIKKV